MSASYKYNWNMPKKHFKIVEQECLDLFNKLADKGEELTEEDYKEIKTFMSENKFLPIRHTINDLQSVILLRSIQNNANEKYKFELNESNWFLKENPFKL